MISATFVKRKERLPKTFIEIKGLGYVRKP